MVMLRLGQEDGCPDPKYRISIESEEDEKNDCVKAPMRADLNLEG